MARWLHAYSLKFGTGVPLSKLMGENGSFINPIDISYNIQKSNAKPNAYELTEHHITFNIKKDNNKEPNESEIVIYNASDNLVNYISNNIKNNLAITLDAGYIGEVKRLFSGTVAKISDKKQGEDRMTTLMCKDGAVNVKESITSRSYPKGTPIKNIFKDLSSDLGTTVGRIAIDAQQSVLPGPIAFVGSTAKNIHRIASSINHNFSIQDGALYITPADKRLKNFVTAITPETGLIGSPETLSMHETKNKKNKNPGDGIKFSCQLDGAITPETTIYVKSKNYDNYFKVTKVTHSGSYEDGEWKTDVECVYVSQVAEENK
jgi:hypothetical protein